VTINTIIKIMINAVWNELVKENRDFFEPYMKSKSKEGTMISQEETTKMISALDSSNGAQQDD
jgi:hypothetical protein